MTKCKLETKMKMRHSARARAREVIQLTKNLEYVGEYCSVAEAARITNVKRTGIFNCLSRKNPANSAGGYIWGYKNEFTDEALKKLTGKSP